MTIAGYRTSLATVALLTLLGCGGPLPPPPAPEPEPEPEAQVEPEAPPRPEIPVEERIRAPFAVLSEGRTAPREPRRALVVLDDAPAAPAQAADTSPPRAPAAPAAAPAAPTAGTGAPTSGNAARPTAPREHTVAVGETFYGIARRYGVTPSALAAVNSGIDSERLRAGQVLRLPAYATRPTGEAEAEAAQQPPAPRPGQTRTHRVVAGETLWGIARRYGVTPDRIRAANRMDDETVRIGQTLVIPNR